MNSLRSLLVEGRMGEARALAAQMLEKVPDEPSAALALARLALAEDDFQQARRWLEVGEARGVSADTLVLRGNLAVQDDDISGAETCFFKALELNPKKAEAFFGLGLLYRMTGHTARAREGFERAVAAETDVPLNGGVMHYQLAELLLEQGDLRGGVEHLQHALVLNPTLVAAYLATVRVFSRIKQYEAARSVLEMGLQVLPQHPRLVEARKKLGSTPAPAFDAKASMRGLWRA
jgi:tetratricopeptide (TPR) repeat protein